MLFVWGQLIPVQCYGSTTLLQYVVMKSLRIKDAGALPRNVVALLFRRSFGAYQDRHKVLRMTSSLAFKVMCMLSPQLV